MVEEILGRTAEVAREGDREAWTYMTTVTGSWGELRYVPAFSVHFRDGRVVETRGDQRLVSKPIL
jgi:hypothetical protein